MKKIGIFAIGAMLFVSVACNKDKSQLEPSTTNYTNSEQQLPPKDPNGGLTPAPINDLENDGSATNTRKIRPKGVRNDEINPYNGTQKEIKPSGIRNDELNNNTSDL